jgi:hypothetical protein
MSYRSFVQHLVFVVLLLENLLESLKFYSMSKKIVNYPNQSVNFCFF